ncbi:MAG TPA: hypothetical protein DCF33_19125 [Saprospirales bacterium]|nr:hypothetical protein [Saprospirales bacterium]
MSDKKALIQELISLGKTEEALEQLEQLTSDAILLQARYNGAKKQYNMGLIEFSEWSRTQAQINYAALEMANAVKHTMAAEAGTFRIGEGDATFTTGGGALHPSGQKVFISYSQKDMLAMRAVKNYLEGHDVHVHIDLNDLSAGESIQGFIDEALRNNNFVISIISKNSLQSGWVSKELVVAKFLNKTNSYWIPVSIDDAWSNNQFYFEATKEIDKKITEARKQITIAIKGNLDISPFIDDEKRLQELKANLGTTISDLKSVLVVDISGQLFDIGMNKVIEKIKKQGA